MSEQDKDAQEAPMAPPAVLASSSGPAVTTPPKAKETQEIHEKYRKLKRRFFELEEKHKETSTELQRSGERNVKMREERNILLDRIIELESQPGFVAAAADGVSPTETSGAFPRSLLSPRARMSFTQNLRDAAAEDDDIDADAEIDPALTSRHVDDATGGANNGRDAGAASGDEAGNAGMDTAAAPVDSPVMVSSTGTRLRIRPVGGEDPPADPALSSVSSHPPSFDPASGGQARSISPDSGGMPVDDENDESGDYSPPQKGTKRSRDSADYNGDALVAVAPEPKQPRRSSRRPAPATVTPTSASRTRVIQTPRRTSAGKGPEAGPSASPATDEGAAQAPKPDSTSPAPENSNGHNTHSDATASSSSASPATRPGSLAFNPYYYLTPAAQMAPGSPYNPYTMYMGVPMPGGPMPYMPPPNFAPPPQQRPPSEAPRAAKPKRLKAHTVTSKSYSIPMVPRDKKGKPMLPLNVGIMTVINLGDVCMREHFHTERYIFPVGYEVTRRYLSTVDQTAEVVYHCTILDGGDGPKFQIIPSDVPDRPVIAGTATGAWSTIVKQANAIRQRQHSNSVSGPDFFGLGQNTIKHLIQELPNADRLRDYVWQHFVEGGPLGGRHAAVIPALPEEYDAAMPIGPYYPPRPQIPRDTPDGPRVSHYPPHIMAQAAQAQAKRAPPPPPQQQQPQPQQQHQQQPQGEPYGGDGRQVMPPGHQAGPGMGGSMSGGPMGGAGSNYYLPHTQQQGNDANPPPPGPGYAPHPPNGGPGYGNGGSGAGGNSSFASIMNAFPTQEGHRPENGGGGEGVAS